MSVLPTDAHKSISHHLIYMGQVDCFSTNIWNPVSAMVGQKIYSPWTPFTVLLHKKDQTSSSLCCNSDAGSGCSCCINCYHCIQCYT